jgi:hypothetical protein
VVATKPLSQYALSVLMEIHVIGIYVWVRGIAAFLDDPQRTRVRLDTVDELLRAGLLIEDLEELTLSVSDAGKAKLEWHKEAGRRAKSIHDALQFVVPFTGHTFKRPKSKSTVHE